MYVEEYVKRIKIIHMLMIVKYSGNIKGTQGNHFNAASNLECQ